MAIVDTAPLRAPTSCPTSRLVDEREAISSSFAVILSMVVKSHLPPVREQTKAPKADGQYAGPGKFTAAGFLPTAL
jgi:hypothetical protein